MLKLGVQNISGLYVGGIKIKKAYLGGNLVYSASEPPVPVVCTVTLSVSPAGAGTAAGGGTYESGQTVTLTYTAADGYNFTGWYDAGGTLLSTANPYSFTAAEDLSITARAVQAVQNYTISASIDPAGSGTVTGTGEYEQGASVTLTAAAADGYNFTGWQEYGTVVSTDNPYTFTAAADRMFTAVFAAVPTGRLPVGYTELEWISNEPNSAGVRPVTENLNVANAGTNYPFFTNAKYDLDIAFMELPTSSISVKPYMLFGSSLQCMYRGPTGSGTTGNITKGNVMEVKCGKKSSTSTSMDKLEFRGAGYLNIPFQIGVKTNITVNVGDRTTTAKPVVNVNDISYTTNNTPSTYSTVTWDKSWCIFGESYYHTSTTASSCSIGAGVPTPTKNTFRLYSFKIYNGNDLLADFVPCKDPSGIVGLYNIVKDVFIKNYDSAAPFTAGPAV